jgi:hypothetical protein
MARSSGFGSTPCDLKSPCSDSLSLRLPYSVKLAGKRKSLTHYTKGTPSPLLEEPSGFLLCSTGSAASREVFCRTGVRQRIPEDASSKGSDCLYACGFRIYFTPLPGFFSPFPHGTGSLSVDHEYLALEDGPPIFGQDFTCPALLVSRLVSPRCLRIRGCHPLWPAFPDRSPDIDATIATASPISLATTLGISVDFCSSGY